MPQGLADITLREVGAVDDEVLRAFDCGEPGLNSFLVDEAKTYARHALTSTYVAFAPDDPACPVGYFSLSADAIRLNMMERGDLGLPFQSNIEFFPAVKITKLAVAVARQSQGLGRQLMELIIGMTYQSQHAVRLVNVNALNNPRTVRFYQSLGFLESLTDVERRERDAGGRRGQAQQYQTVLMHLDIYAD